MIAEGLAAGLGRFPELCPIGVATTASEAVSASEGADVVVLAESLPGSDEAALAIRRRGVRVVVVGDESGEEAEGEGARVSPRASLSSLAVAVAPRIRARPASPRGLTDRERTILALVGRGLPGKQVARHLGISPKTVEHHKSRIYSKLGVANQAAAVRLLVEHESGRG
jgi:DNA-binding NarL/FixJ family response regulator